MKRFVRYTFLILLMAVIISGCTFKQSNDEITFDSDKAYKVRTGILYNGNEDDYTWKSTMDYWQQSLVLNLEVDGIDANDTFAVDQYDLLYLDKSLASIGQSKAFVEAITEFVKKGGTVVLSNELYALFPNDFIGAESFHKINNAPIDLKYPEVEGDLVDIQNIIKDFTVLYPSFSDYDFLSHKDYGVGLVPNSAVTIAATSEHSIYTMNRFGEGYVFFLNPLLPNHFSLSNFSMRNSSNEQSAFSSTTASSNQLLLNSFAEYESKQKYGYSLNRIFGYFGSSSMAWQLHYEEITGIENNSMKLFSELCKEYLQVPSFSLIRNSYLWYLRAESITYLLNKGTEKEAQYEMDFNENAYSSGTHIVSNSKWLSQSKIENAGSYFVDYPKYDFRAYPYLFDVNNDSRVDILSGSSDGKFYFYLGEGFNDRLLVSEAQALTNCNHEIIQVPGYSAPQALDINQDGYLDLISGSNDGNIYWFSGNDSIEVNPEGILISTDFKGQTLPSIGDVNQDGIIDLMVGSNQGNLSLYFGSKSDDGSIQYSKNNMKSYSNLVSKLALGQWISPELADVNHDGILDLSIGTYDGYIAQLHGSENGQFNFVGYVEMDEQNYKGNNNAKFGNYAVPVLYDINADRKLDLVCGACEYGLAYPIDSDYFPYKKKLANQINYANKNYYYVGMHYYTNAFASDNRERVELQSHVSALKQYGVNVDTIGVNQHTWYTSSLNAAQSLLNAYHEGMYWNSGFASSGASWKAPQIAAENVIALPFYLKENDDSTILVQNNSTLPYTSDTWSEISAKYKMPIGIYYHCDFVYESDEKARKALQKTSDFQWKYNYNFNTEDQMMLASAAAYNLEVDVTGDIKEDRGIVVTAESISNENPLYREEVQNSMGIKISLSDKIDINQLDIDSDVWYVQDGDIFTGLNRPISIYTDTTPQNVNKDHIERVNVAAKIDLMTDGASLEFLDDGMMQVVVKGIAYTEQADWIVKVVDGKTIFTKYGKRDVLKIKF